MQKFRSFSGKRVSVCYNHHSVVHQIPSVRHLIPQPALLFGVIKGGVENKRAPASGTRIQDGPHLEWDREERE